jgi:rubrerythrin
MPEFVNPFIGMKPDRVLTHHELLRALRLSLSAEEEAVHIYEAIADACENKFVSSVLRDIANEERVHKGEFQRVIEILAPDEIEFMKKGAEEVDEIKQMFKKAENENGIAPIPVPGNLKKQMVQ